MDKRLIDTLDAGQRRTLENVRAAAERIWSRPVHRYYTDHTVAHSERVIALLNGLTAGIMATDKTLSPTEIFVLLAAAYLHDIGMQNERFAGGDLDEIRAHHNEQTAEMIYAVFEDPENAFVIPLTRDPGLVEAVALVAKGHRRMDLHGTAYEPLVHGGETLRLRLLAALLRFGDELDIDHRRVDIEQMKLLALPVESQFHWWKCHYVSGVSIVDEYIRVAYRFPQDRPDYEGLIVPLVEGEVRAKHAALEEIFRANAVKVALGSSQVRLMRLVQPLPPEVEILVQEWVEAGEEAPSRFAPAAPVRPSPEKPVVQPSSPPASVTVFDQRNQTVGTQINVAGDYVDRRTPSRGRDVPSLEDGNAEFLRRQLSEARENLRLIQERKFEYVQEEEIPLQLIKNERRLLKDIAELEQQIEELGQSMGDKPSALGEITGYSLKDALPLERAEIRHSLSIQEKFSIANRYFDEESDPQVIVFEFTNRGDSTFKIREIRYSDRVNGLPNSALLQSYKVKDGRLIIPVDADKSAVEPGKVFRVELGLLQVWKRQHIDAMAGTCGFLYIDVIYGGESTTLQYSI